LKGDRATVGRGDVKLQQNLIFESLTSVASGNCSTSYKRVDCGCCETTGYCFTLVLFFVFLVKAANAALPVLSTTAPVPASGQTEKVFVVSQRSSPDV